MLLRFPDRRLRQVDAVNSRKMNREDVVREGATKVEDARIGGQSQLPPKFERDLPHPAIDMPRNIIAASLLVADTPALSQ
jgi:hypothetical protein